MESILNTVRRIRRQAIRHDPKVYLAFCYRENALPLIDFFIQFVFTFMSLQQCATSDDLQNQLQLLQQQLKAARYQPIRRSFAIWLSRLLRVKFKTESIPEYQELTEVNAMLAERLTDWTLQWKKEGEEIGEKRGEKRGEKIGQKKEALRLLIRLSQLKYGELPDWAVQNMEQADLQQLENWAERILTAESLEALMT
ncbi:MAG: hypothetical protein U1E01_18615 [Methylicorpusculum sp.]|nr:hypothetical protein [Methylicorpusculum sp.]